ncbi:hypothetical protein, partial [Photobacterium swingsii]|uniref:hypothetical protein n=1 Tax=Photobacterium swingsii TaxID=680026 RepID=UPI0040691788
GSPERSESTLPVPKARKGNSPKGASLRAVNPYLSATFKKGANLLAPFLRLSEVKRICTKSAIPKALRHIRKNR